MKELLNDLKKLIELHSVHLTEKDNENEWYVLEVSDIENIIDNYESKFNNGVLDGVSKSATIKSSGDFRDDDNRESQAEYFGIK